MDFSKEVRYSTEKHFMPNQAESTQDASGLSGVAWVKGRLRAYPDPPVVAA